MGFAAVCVEAGFSEIQSLYVPSAGLVPVELEADGIAESMAVNNFSHVASGSVSNHFFHKSLQQLLVSLG